MLATYLIVTFQGENVGEGGGGGLLLLGYWKREILQSLKG